MKQSPSRLRAQVATELQRSPCPVACTLDVIGDRWTLLVVRDLMRGVSRFSDFLLAPEAIATNILTVRLNRLVETGIAERVPSIETAGRSAYRLTPLGETLRPVMEAIASWGLTYLPGTQSRLKPIAGTASAKATRPVTAVKSRRQPTKSP
jgi:DNA-binding HxlR family transcriptional regulator